MCYKSWSYQITHADTNFLLVLEPFLNNRHECPEEELQSAPKPWGNAVSWHSCPQECMRGRSGGRKTSLFWMRSTHHCPLVESHCVGADPYWGHGVLQISVLGMSVGFYLFLLGHFPPDLLPPALHPLHWLHCCRNESWLALQKWPNFPQHSELCRYSWHF